MEQKKDEFAAGTGSSDRDSTPATPAEGTGEASGTPAAEGNGRGWLWFLLLLLVLGVGVIFYNSIRRGESAPSDDLMWEFFSHEAQSDGQPGAAATPPDPCNKELGNVIEKVKKLKSDFQAGDFANNPNLLDERRREIDKDMKKYCDGPCYSDGKLLCDRLARADGVRWETITGGPFGQ